MPVATHCFPFWNTFSERQNSICTRRLYIALSVMQQYNYKEILMSLNWNNGYTKLADFSRIIKEAQKFVKA